MLILTQNEKKAFSWGDNYYGQLGLGKLMLPWTERPTEINILEGIKSIVAYKDNSFAIDCKYNIDIIIKTNIFR